MKRKSAEVQTPTVAPIVSEAKTEADRRKYRGKVPVMAALTNSMAMLGYTSHLGEFDTFELLQALTDETKKVCGGDLKSVEAMLFGQATTLQTVFVDLALKAARQKHLTPWEGYMRMALKAQNQCRMTLETLAAIKNPPVVYARQANIANGPQQVNNHVGTAAPEAPTGAPAANSAIVQTELLEAHDGQWMDTGTARAAIGADPQLEAVGTLYRATQR